MLEAGTYNNTRWLNVPALQPYFILALGLGGWYTGHRLLRFLEAQRVADWGRPWLNRLDGLNRWWCRRFHRLRHDDMALPACGGALVVANHVSGLDPLLMLAASPRPLRFLIARDEYERWWLRWLFRAIGCIPVAHDSTRSALRLAQEALERGEVVALFPQGGIRLDGPVRLKRGVAVLAQATGVPIFPVRLDGIHGRGMKVAAVFLRSRARLTAFPPVNAAGRDPDAVLEELSRVLSGDSG